MQVIILVFCLRIAQLAHTPNLQHLLVQIVILHELLALAVQQIARHAVQPQLLIF